MTEDVAAFSFEMSGLPMPDHPDYRDIGPYGLIEVDAREYRLPPEGGHCVMVIPDPRGIWTSTLLIHDVGQGRHHASMHPCDLCADTVAALSAQRFTAWVMDVV